MVKNRPHPGSALDAAYASGLIEDPDYKRVSNKKGGTRIVDDDQWPQRGQCKHPEHEPPKHIVIPLGKKMVHTCPGCGQSITIRPMAISWTGSDCGSSQRRRQRRR